MTGLGPELDPRATWPATPPDPRRVRARDAEMDNAPGKLKAHDEADNAGGELKAHDCGKTPRCRRRRRRTRRCSIALLNGAITELSARRTGTPTTPLRGDVRRGRHAMSPAHARTHAPRASAIAVVSARSASRTMTNSVRDPCRTPARCGKCRPRLWTPTCAPTRGRCRQELSQIHPIWPRWGTRPELTRFGRCLA